MDAKETVEVAYHQIAERHDERSPDLDEELIGSLHAVAVVDETYQVDYQSAKRHGYRRYTEHILLAAQKDTCPRGHIESRHGCRQENQSAKTRHGLAMHLPFIGKVEIMVAEACLDNQRQGDGCHDDCRKKGSESGNNSGIHVV